MKIPGRTLFFLFLPSIIAIALIFIFPLTQLLRLSFTDASLGKDTDFVGLANYRDFVSGGDFGPVLGRTMLWTAGGVVLKIGIGIIGALLINSRGARRAGRSGRWSFRGISRALVLPPWVMPLTISAIVWTWLLNGQYGLISSLLQRLSIIEGPFEFLGSRRPALLSVLMVDVWAGLPLITIFIIAALEGIPRDSLEAAAIEGAGRFQRMRYVVLPRVRPVILSLSAVTAIFTFNSFDVIWVMTQGGPSDGTTTLPILAYRSSIRRFEVGAGAAQSVVMSLMLFALVGIYFSIRRGAEGRGHD